MIQDTYPHEHPYKPDSGGAALVSFKLIAPHQTARKNLELPDQVLLLNNHPGECQQILRQMFQENKSIPNNGTQQGKDPITPSHWTSKKDACMMRSWLFEAKKSWNQPKPVNSGESFCRVSARMNHCSRYTRKLE